jgi:hypothetical protein
MPRPWKSQRTETYYAPVARVGSQWAVDGRVFTIVSRATTAGNRWTYRGWLSVPVWRLRVKGVKNSDLLVRDDDLPLIAKPAEVMGA